jgi:peptidoglycan-associated lipoprotein
MRARKHRSVEVLVSVLGILLLAGACNHKKKVVTPPPPPPPPPPKAAPVCTLTAEPTTIEKGQSATLSWTSENATTLNLEPGVGNVQASGSQSVTPDDSTTYTLTATGEGGSNTCEARVTVTAPPPPPPPPPPPAGPTEEELFNQNMQTAYFNFDKSDIRSDAQQALQHDADFLKQHSDIKFTFEGNCDERGSEEYNLGLGQRRADAAKKYIVDLGIPADNVSTISYGKDRPVCTDHNEECWQKNRNAHPAWGSESQPAH